MPFTFSRWVYHFGWLNFIAAIGLTSIAIFQPKLIGAYTEGLYFTLGLFLVVSSCLIFTGQQLKAGTDLGHKALPASLVAYGLFLLMAFRWLSHV